MELSLVLCADQRGEMEITGGRSERKGIYEYIWLIHFIVKQLHANKKSMNSKKKS